ncbi:pentapeptide repeat-containing protein [Streptomyces griseosporeus]|uniref:pentapeptide repeat-containing protein n=1 Tax=Streptomyces griseosporeus TaxID=1910 RepID=UPI00379B67A1
MDRVQIVTLVAATMPGLAALAALLFTGLQLGQANKELRIAQRGQLTSRFNAAITNLGADSLDRRLGGIYALQTIMQDSARDQPTVVSVLSAYARRHAGSSAKSLTTPVAPEEDTYQPAVDVQAAIAALAGRRPADNNGTIVDLTRIDLRGLHFTGKAPISLPGAELSNADLRWAHLGGADLQHTSLNYADLERADLNRANLAAASLVGANLESAALQRADLRRADMSCGEKNVWVDETPAIFVVCADLKSAAFNSADLRYATLEYADLSETQLPDADLRNANLRHTTLKAATLTHADLRNANLQAADLSNADLGFADLRNADLRNANFSGATLTGMKLQGAQWSGARGLPSEGR